MGPIIYYLTGDISNIPSIVLNFVISQASVALNVAIRFIVHLFVIDTVIIEASRSI